MNVMRGIWIDGRIVLDDRAEWPDGSRVEVALSSPGHESLGMREEDWPTDRRGIEELVARMDESEPLEITPEEERDQAAWRREIANDTMVTMQKDVEGLTS